MEYIDEILPELIMPFINRTKLSIIHIVWEDWGSEAFIYQPTN